MADAHTAMLFCPPLPPLRLASRMPIFIGRQPSCALALCKDDVSRRHAEVRFEDGGFVIHDLESTNGTFVNGEPVTSARRLEPGDTIGIGPFDVSFCTFDNIDGGGMADFGHGAGDQTIVCQRPVEPRLSFSGELSEIPPMALFQLLEMGSNSGRLEIDSTEGSGQVWFEMGHAVHAKTDKLEGLDAAIEMVAVISGQFRFGPDSAKHEHTIDASTTKLLLEACRRADESAGAEDDSAGNGVDDFFG